MPALHVRNVPDEVYDALRRRAEREGRSISTETIAILRGALDQHDREKWLEEFERVSSPLPDGAPRPEELIRELRDADDPRRL